MKTVEDVKSILGVNPPTADAADVLATEATAVTEKAGELPGFVKGILCKFLPLVRNFLKLDGEQDAAFQTVITIVCGL